jgi:hypothetical protein
MTLGEIRARVCRSIGMSASSTEDIALIDGWVNDGITQFLKDTKINVVTAAMATTEGVSDYTLDEDILSFTDVWYAPADGSQGVLLEPLDSRELLRMQMYEGSADVYPRYYAMQGAHLLLLYPTPSSSSDMVHILYTPRPGLISQADQQPSDETKGAIPQEFHVVIEAYVKWKAAQAEEHRPSEFGLTFQAEYERGISMVRSSMNRKKGVFQAPAKVGRRPLFPMTPGTDLR